MTRSFRFPRFTVFASLCLGLVLAAGPASAVSLEESSLFNLAAHDNDHARNAGQAFRDCADCPEMVVPPHWSYAVGVSEVTRGEWAAFVRATGYTAGHSCWTYEHGAFQERRGRSWRNPGFSQTARHPVVCVNWHDAQAYLRWLRAKTGQAYGLVSDEEWADVARGMNLDRTPGGVV